MVKSLNFAPELQLRGHKRIFSAHGEREKREFKPVFDKRGIWHLEQTGTSNTYLDIQSHADSVDINVIMARFRAGETDVLQQIQNQYGDVSDMPTNFADIVNAQLKAEALFMSLSAEVRAKFNNSVEQFMARVGTREGLEALGYKFDTQPNPEPKTPPTASTTPPTASTTPPTVSVNNNGGKIE